MNTKTNAPNTTIKVTPKSLPRVSAEGSISAWIDIKDKQPEAGTEVLICGPELYTMSAHQWAGEWLCDGVLGEEDIVTHWMPLPKPFKVQA